MTSTETGAALCTTSRRLEVSNAARSASGSFSIRTNIVATNWPWVTRYRSISSSARTASKRSITTTVPPLRIVPSDQPIGAPW